jgi:hypothetical protein
MEDDVIFVFHSKFTLRSKVSDVFCDFLSCISLYIAFKFQGDVFVR